MYFGQRRGGVRNRGDPRILRRAGVGASPSLSSSVALAIPFSTTPNGLGHVSLPLHSWERRKEVEDVGRDEIGVAP